MLKFLNNFTALWLRTTEEQRIQGSRWYPEARATIRGMARRHWYSEATVAGVVAALSPRLHWCRNLQVAERVLTSGTSTGVFKANLHKAAAILSGARPLKILSGPKVRAFYRALVGQRTSVVIDVWMARVAGLTTSLTGQVYAKLADALTALAKRFGVTPADAQAILWVTARGRAT